jgi:hypothetical protein
MATHRVMHTVVVVKIMAVITVPVVVVDAVLYAAQPMIL